MSYLELYIEGSGTPGPIVSGINYMYLLPGLLDYHTPKSTTEAELLEWKKEYNYWLEIVRDRTDKYNNDETLTKEEKAKLRFNLEHWAGTMYDLLQKIGRYTTREMQKGFTLE